MSDERIEGDSKNFEGLEEDLSTGPSDEILNTIFQVARRSASEAIERYTEPLDIESEELIIYQYTNGAGLEGMLRSGKIWATATEYLNDAQELLDGLNHALEICEELVNRASSSDRFKKFIGKLSNRSEVRGSYFVACFTENGDQLSQWRGYGDGGNGYAVGFSLKDLVSNFKSAIRSISNISSGGFNRVIYDETMKMVIIEHYIESYYSSILDALGEKVFDQYIDTIVSFCFMALHDIFSLIKHEAFSEEDEIRASFYEFLNGASKVRRRGNLFVPYYEIGDGPRLPIREIIVGPTSDFSLTKRGLEAIISSLNFEEKIEIRSSAAPYKA